MITYTTINREIAAWIRDYREQWMSPSKASSVKAPQWGFWKRFACAFVGALTFIITLFLVRFRGLGIEYPDIATPDIFGFYVNVLVIFLFLGIPYSIWFSWLVSWRDFGHGPVRLFLSGMFLPAFVYTVVGVVVTRFAA